MEEIVKPKLDIIFKMLMTSSDDVLRGFLSAVLDIDRNSVGTIVFENPENLPEDPEGKQSQMDLKMSVGDKILNIEIQICNKGNYPERSLYYWAKMFSGELKKGQYYSELKKTICVNIVDFNLFTSSEEPFSTFSVLEEKRHERLTDKCALLFFELGKVDDKVDKDNLKKLWMQLIKAETKEELDMLEQTGNTDIKEAITILHKMTADEKVREAARLREKAILDEASMKDFAEKQGITKERARIIANMRADGVSEEQIRRYTGG